MSYRTKLSEDNIHILYRPIASSPVPMLPSGSYRTKLSEDNIHILYRPIASSPVPTERSVRREAKGPILITNKTTLVLLKSVCKSRKFFKKYKIIASYF